MFNCFSNKPLPPSLEEALKLQLTDENHRLTKLISQLTDDNTHFKTLICALQTEIQIDQSNPLLCPITHEPIKELVMNEIDGRCYEKTAITNWLKIKNTSPLTNETMEHSHLHETPSIYTHIIKLHAELHKARARMGVISQQHTAAIESSNDTLRTVQKQCTRLKIECDRLRMNNTNLRDKNTMRIIRPPSIPPPSPPSSPFSTSTSTSTST
jgi:hypothetical protein